MASNFGLLFSDSYSIDPNWFSKNSVLDPTLDVDTPLFMDPFLLSKSVHREFRVCAFDKYVEHFETVHKLILQSQNQGDKPWNAARKRFQFSESGMMAGTCLGYTKKSIRGHGFGPKLTNKALLGAKQIIDLGVNDPELFSLLSLFEDKIGPDLISDMVATITIDCILQFNTRVLKKIHTDTGKKVPLKEWKIIGRTARLPANTHDYNLPVILLSSDILRALPVMDNPRDLKRVAEENAEIRDRVSEHIGEIWKVRTKKDKDHIKQQAIENAESFQAFLDLIKIAESRGYDIRKDPMGLLDWRTDGKNFAAIHALRIEDDKTQTEKERIEGIVDSIVNQFIHLVEKCRMNAIFFVDGEPRHEHYAQRLFYVIASTYCLANNLDVSPEADAGVGPVDFKFSSGKENVVVEIKLSTNSKVVNGFTKQLKAYVDANRSNLGIYVLIDVGKIGTKWDRIVELTKDSRFSNAKIRPVLVDGTLKSSASKR